MDPLADMLVRIKNAQRVHKEAVSFGYSKIKWEIARLLERTGFIGAASRKGRKNKKLIEATLFYDTNGQPKIINTRRISKPSRRVYRGFREIYSPKNGFGIAVYSTPQGLLTDKEARKGKVGGEILFELW